MINIKVIKNHVECHVEIQGHANYAPIGQDVVCAAVSVLYQNMLESIRVLTNDDVFTSSHQDIQVARIKGISAASNILINSFLIGVKDIANSYPNHVQVN